VGTAQYALHSRRHAKAGYEDQGVVGRRRVHVSQKLPP